MPVTPQRHYSVRRLGILFACAGLALLASLVWLIKVDHDRPWRRFQNEFTELQASLAYFDVLATRTQESTQALEAARSAVEAAEAELAGRQVGSLQRLDLQHLEDRSAEIRGDLARVELRCRDLESRHRAAVVNYERYRSLRGEDSQQTRTAREKLSGLEIAFAEAKHQLQQLADERDAIEARTGRLRAGVDRARRALETLEKREADILRRYEELASRTRRGLLNFPLVDFAAPKGTPGRNEIRQVVLPDVRRELNFVETDTTDRCMTCHVAIADSNFAKENLVRRLEKAAFAINEHLRNEGEPELVLPAVEGREDLPPGSVAQAWHTLSDDQRDAYLTALTERINGFQAGIGKPPLRFEQPMLAHPDLELFVSPDSPHPMSRMGCTVCHEGSGEETDFVLAAHTPADENQLEEWGGEYCVRTAGLATEHDFAEVREHWDRPMLRPEHIEASCTKCHPEVTDMAVHDLRPAATRINEGRLLFTSLGCANCHLVDQLADARRVGPDLTHVAEKLTRGFTHNWTWRPRDYRPATYMPHSFGLENNDASSDTAGGDADPELRTRTEVIAMTEYLFAVSQGYEGEAPPAELWEAVREETSDAARAVAERGRQLFDTLGCLACHAALAHAPSDADDTPGEPLGATWIAEDLAHKMLPQDEQERDQLSDEAWDQVWDQAYRQYDEMTYVDRVSYAMSHFAGERDTIFNPEHTSDPVFTRSAPELSSARTAFGGYEQAMQWSYDWLLDPRHYAGQSRMPRMKLTSPESMDLAVYLATLDENETFSTQPFDSDPVKATAFAAQRDKLIRALLTAEHSPRYAESFVDDETGQLTNELVAQLAGVLGEQAARSTVESLDLQRRRWMFLGRQMIGHYGCYACHVIPGFEKTARVGPELTDWGEKPLSQLDFGLLDRSIEPGRVSFARNKLGNPRIWDRGRIKPPYDKLKMPNFSLADRQVDALVTFLLSRKPARVTPAVQIDYDNTVTGRVAKGRHLAREFNCVACHLIDGNAAAGHQHYWQYEGGELVFNEEEAPPRLRGTGSRVQSPWLFAYLHRVEPIRPWLDVRMPEFDLTDEEATRLVEYAVGLSQEESQWLADRLASEWFRRERLTPSVDSLRRYALTHRIAPAHTLDPNGADTGVLAAAHPRLLRETGFLSEAFAVTYPFTETAPQEVDPDEIADGRFLFAELNCLQCHSFGDPTVPGANANPTAPDLQNVSRRLRREWVQYWLQGPRRLRAGTRMPNFFGEDQTSPFDAYPPEERAKVEARLLDKTLVDDAARQIRAITDFLFDASEKRLNVVADAATEKVAD